MKKPPWYIVCVILFVALVVAALSGRKYFLKHAKDKIQGLFQQNIEQQVPLNPSDSIISQALLDIYYKNKPETLLWIGTGEKQAHNRAMLADMLAYGGSLGLSAKDYHAAYIKKYDSLIRIAAFDADEYKNEQVFTDAALTFLFQVSYGKNIGISYNGIKYNIDSSRIINLFSQMLVHHNWRQTIDSLEPKSEQYNLLKTAAHRIDTFIRVFPQIDSIDTSNARALKANTILKLKAYGLLDVDITGDSVSDKSLTSALCGFQKMTGLEITGKLDKKTLTELQIPLSKRLEEINRSLNFWRWAQRIAEPEFVLVNIAAARLQVIDDSENIDMKVIAGEYNKQTPLFTAYITRITTYPHWVVPRSIATKEILRQVQKDTGVLRKNNMEVMDYKGNILDISAINWHQYSKNNFPFIIRQATGCDDALGILKFDLNSPYDIYLHDTNAKGMFKRNYRLLSHGCVRLEKPFELAKYLLGDRFDTTLVDYLNRCMKNQEPQEIRVKKRVPAIIYYMTVDINEDGNVEFFNDAYGLEKPN